MNEFNFKIAFWNSKTINVHFSYNQPQYPHSLSYTHSPSKSHLDSAQPAATSHTTLNSQTHQPHFHALTAHCTSRVANDPKRRALREDGEHPMLRTNKRKHAVSCGEYGCFRGIRPWLFVTERVKCLPWLFVDRDDLYRVRGVIMLARLWEGLVL